MLDHPADSVLNLPALRRQRQTHRLLKRGGLKPTHNAFFHLVMDSTGHKCGKITSVSLGMIVLDELRFPGREPLYDVPGGSGLYSK